MRKIRLDDSCLNHLTNIPVGFTRKSSYMHTFWEITYQNIMYFADTGYVRTWRNLYRYATVVISYLLDILEAVYGNFATICAMRTLQRSQASRCHWRSSRRWRTERVWRGSHPSPTAARTSPTTWWNIASRAEWSGSEQPTTRSLRRRTRWKAWRRTWCTSSACRPRTERASDQLPIQLHPSPSKNKSVRSICISCRTLVDIK